MNSGTQHSGKVPVKDFACSIPFFDLTEQGLVHGKARNRITILEIGHNIGVGVSPFLRMDGTPPACVQFYLPGHHVIGHFGPNPNSPTRRLDPDFVLVRNPPRLRIHRVNEDLRFRLQLQQPGDIEML